ncbi:hypothetical protein B4113_0047 [Geobacillus sp. B4113_201601]|nr:hypothetical protein B4113_0047 [Geobacillus sp. B4113_201601]
MKHVVRDDKMKAIGDIAFRQTVRSPLAETARLFKKQWDELVGNVASVSWQPAYAGMGPAPRGWMSEARNEVKDATFHMIKKAEGEVVGKGTGETVIKDTYKPVSLNQLRLKNGMKMKINDALEAAEKFLEPGYKDMGNGRFVSTDGTRVVRMGDGDILGKHGGGPHMNFETLVPNPSKPGKMKVDQNLHIYFGGVKWIFRLKFQSIGMIQASNSYGRIIS